MTSRTRSIEPLLIIACGACAPLELIGALECGNGVTEPAVAEDCDGEPRCADPGSEHACRFLCERPADCPLSFGCGVDGVCRQHSGRFEAAVEEQGATLMVMARDLDHDDHDDLLVVTGEQILIDFFNSDLELIDQSSIDRHPADVAPVVDELTSTSSAGDGMLDVAVGVELGARFGSGLGVFRLSTARSLVPSVYPTVPMTGEHAIAVSLRAVPPFSREQSLLFAKSGEQTRVIGLDDDRIVDLELPPTVSADPETLAGLVAADLFSTSPCEEAIFAHAGGDRAYVMSVCVEAGAEVSWSVEAVIVELLLPFGIVLREDRALFAADFEGDGDLDLFLVTTGPVPIYLVENRDPALGLLNDPTPLGSLTRAALDPCLESGQSSGVPLAFADFNRDGAIDVVTDDAVLVSTALGHTAVEHCLDWSQVAVADFDRNGSLDIAAARIDEPDVEIAFGAGDGAFTWRNIFTEHPVLFVAAGDFDGDFVADLAYVEAAEEREALLIAFGSASGGFEPARAAGTVDRLRSLTTGRIEGPDAADDLLLVSSLEAGELSIAQLSGSGSRQLVAPYVLREPHAPPSAIRDLTAGHFSSASAHELAVLVEDEAGASRLWSVEVRGEDRLSSATSAPIDCPRCSLVAIDLDGDRDELIAFGDGAAQIWETRSAVLTLREVVPLNGVTVTSDEFREPAVLDLDGDGRREIVLLAATQEGSEVLVFFNRGTGSIDLGSALRISLRDASAFAVLDLDLDGEAEILVANEDETLAFDLRGERRRFDFGLSFSAESMAGGDFDGDGVLDLVMSNSAGYAILRGVPVR